MIGQYKVITLCGSTRFKDAFLEAQKRLTLEGNIVISVGLFGHSGDEEVWKLGTKKMLDDMIIKLQLHLIMLIPLMVLVWFIHGTLVRQSPSSYLIYSTT